MFANYIRTVHQVVAVPILVATCLKLFEMSWLSIRFNLHYGRRLGRAYHAALSLHGWHRARSIVRRFQVNPWRASDRILGSLPRRFRGPLSLLLSWPVLTCASALGGYHALNDSGMYLLLGAILLLLTRIAHRLVARLTLGAADNVRSHHTFSVGRVPTRSDLASALVLEFLVDMVMIAITFGCLFAAGDALDARHFHPAAEHLSLIKGLYLSLVTMTTTGFGDLYPLTPIAMLFVMAEIATTFLLVTVLLFHYGITFVSADEAPRPRTRGNTGLTPG